MQSCLEAEYITGTVEHSIQTGQSSVPDRVREVLELQVRPDYVGVQHLLIEHAAARPTRRFAYREETLEPFGTSSERG